MLAPSKTIPSPNRIVVRRSKQKPRTRYPYVILGAGCAGLSLAWNLVQSGVDEPILIVDRRRRFENDRTWCFWDVEPTPFSDLATHSWSRWRVHDGQDEVVAEGAKFQYLRLRAIDVYQRILDRLAAAPQVTMMLGQPILNVQEEDGGVRIVTPDRQYRGDRVFDSSGRATAFPRVIRGPQLLQHFLGQTIRANRPVFDTSCPTLMDFQVTQDDGPHFVYVLPLSETEALVENTYLYPFLPSEDRHRREIAAYLQARHGLEREAYKVIAEEAGAIPMAVEARTSRPASRIEAIGLAGGAARPCSGYAFLRIQRQTRRIAEAIAAGGEGPREPLSSWKYDLLDTIFLKVLAERPDLVPELFGRMFRHADPSSVVRFLSETSTPVDDVRIVASLPKWPFMAAAARLATSYRPEPINAIGSP